MTTPDSNVPTPESQQDLLTALQCAESGDATHWPTVAGILADAYRSALKERDDTFNTLTESLLKTTADRDRLSAELASVKKERDEAVRMNEIEMAAYIAARNTHWNGREAAESERDTALAQLAEAKAALFQYRKGDTHSDAEEFVAAAAHYNEGDRLRDKILPPIATEPDDLQRKSADRME